jgi:hypothetical protein
MRLEGVIKIRSDVTVKRLCGQSVVTAIKVRGASVPLQYMSSCPLLKRLCIFIFASVICDCLTNMAAVRTYAVVPTLTKLMACNVLKFNAAVFLCKRWAFIEVIFNVKHYSDSGKFIHSFPFDSHYLRTVYDMHVKFCVKSGYKPACKLYKNLIYMFWKLFTCGRHENLRF